MVPGLTKKPGLLDLKPKSQKNLNSLIVPGSLNSPVISIEINDSDKEIPILNQEKPNNDLKKDDVFIKLSDVNLENNLLEIKTTCDEGQLKQKAASQRKLLSVPQNPTEASDFRRFSCTQLKGLPEISVLSIEDDVEDSKAQELQILEREVSTESTLDDECNPEGELSTFACNNQDIDTVFDVV